MLSIILTVIVVLLIIGILFSPESWGYSRARNPLVVGLIVLLVLFLVLHPL